MDSIKQKLQKIIDFPLYTDNDIVGELVNIVYDNYKENMLDLFLIISEKDKNRIKEEKNILYHGLQESMHNLSGIANDLLNQKTSRQAKDQTKYLFESDNIASLIQTCKAYFPDGTAKGASNSGKWFFETFKENVIKNKEHYLEGGKYYSWTQGSGNEDYIKLVLGIDNKNK